MSKPKVSSPDRQEVEFIVREYLRTRGRALRDRLIAQHLYLVQTVARKFSGLGASHEDLLQEGAMGLINAVDLYDPDRGVQFSTYTTHLVEGQIRHYLRDKGKLIKQPAWVQELTTKIVKATEVLVQELNREPTPAEIAARVGATPAAVQRMLEAKERSKVTSLDAASGEEDSAPAIDPEKLRGQIAGEPEFQVEDRIFLREAMSRLKALEQKVVYGFYFLDLNRTEMAHHLGISVNYASYLLRGAMTTLRRSFEAQQVADMDMEPVAPAPTRSAAYAVGPGSLPADPATGLVREEAFLERLAQELERARRYPQQVAIMLAEADRADLHEPQRLSLARLLRANVCSIDLVAQLREGQISLLFPLIGREATVLAERLVQAAASRLGGGEGAFTISLGFAVYPTDGHSAEGLLAGAEEAMGEAKHQGGNRFLRGKAPAPPGGAVTACREWRGESGEERPGPGAGTAGGGGEWRV